MKVIKTMKLVNVSDFPGALPHNEKRYVITDDNGKIIDDAQGYGYKTYDKAMKALWWKFKDGKKKSNKKVVWWKKHVDLWRAINEDLEYWCKEICLGEFTDDDIENMCKERAMELNVDLPDDMLKFMFTKYGSKMLNKELR